MAKQEFQMLIHQLFFFVIMRELPSIGRAFHLSGAPLFHWGEIWGGVTALGTPMFQVKRKDQLSLDHAKSISIHIGFYLCPSLSLDDIDALTDFNMKRLDFLFDFFFISSLARERKGNWLIKWQQNQQIIYMRFRLMMLIFFICCFLWSLYFKVNCIKQTFIARK